MGKYNFSTDLSVKGIKNLQKQLLDYKNNTLQHKVELYVKKLAELGTNVINTKVEESPLGHYVTLKTDISEEKTGYKAILIATGEVKESEGYAPFNTLLAIEFGAGIHYNKTPNPNADKFGLGVGTFPGQIHAFEDFWFYWDEEKQKWMPTHGVKATMPMYNADVEIIKNYAKIAKEVFG